MRSFGALRTRNRTKKEEELSSCTSDSPDARRGLDHTERPGPMTCRTHETHLARYNIIRRPVVCSYEALHTSQLIDLACYYIRQLKQQAGCPWQKLAYSKILYTTISWL